MKQAYVCLLCLVCGEHDSIHCPVSFATPSPAPLRVYLSASQVLPLTLSCFHPSPKLTWGRSAFWGQRRWLWWGKKSFLVRDQRKAENGAAVENKTVLLLFSLRLGPSSSGYIHPHLYLAPNCPHPSILYWLLRRYLALSPVWTHPLLPSFKFTPIQPFWLPYFSSSTPALPLILGLACLGCFLCLECSFPTLHLTSSHLKVFFCKRPAR